MIPFSPPRIDQRIIDEVTSALQSGWITTGPRTKEFERRLSAYCGAGPVVALNSATAGLELVLRWFGVKPGDEVIVPAYTYCATANVVVHCGATPVMADVNPVDFNINPDSVKSLISEKTKVIIPVDFAGLPCNYDCLNNLVLEKEVRSKFKPDSAGQEKLGRILILSDAAHSFGAMYNGRKAGSFTDITVFSFHAVKNLTTAEGGAVVLNLPESFDKDKIYSSLTISSLHGQNKDALAKTQKGNWRYDVVEAGYKCNMTDLAAAIGLVELERYDEDMLVRRKAITEEYNRFFSRFEWAELPVTATANSTSSYHLYPLRIRGITEEQRDRIIQQVFEQEVSVNVHFIPLPLLSFYSNMGYKASAYPVAIDNYSREISLPVYYDLSDEQVNLVCQAVEKAVNTVIRT